MTTNNHLLKINVIRKLILLFCIPLNVSILLGGSLDSIKIGNAMKRHSQLRRRFVGTLSLLLVLVLHHFSFQYANCADIISVVETGCSQSAL